MRGKACAPHKTLACGSSSASLPSSNGIGPTIRQAFYVSLPSRCIWPSGPQRDVLVRVPDGWISTSHASTLCIHRYTPFSFVQVSCTITFDPETEGQHLAHALDYFQYQLKGVSFLPRTDYGAFPQVSLRFASVMIRSRPSSQSRIQ